LGSLGLDEEFWRDFTLTTLIPSKKKRKERIISISEERRKQGTGHCQTGLLSPGNMGPTYAPSSQNLVSSSSPFEGL
jgi:hypothetical protein